MLTSTHRSKLNAGDSPGTFSGLGKAIDKAPCMLKCTYDFAVGGGAIGDVSLRDADGELAVVPSGAFIQHVLVEVVTACLSTGAATVALKSEGAADLLGATAVASLTLDAKLDGVPLNTAATTIKMTADRTIKATIAAFALTAGKINVYIHYVS